MRSKLFRWTALERKAAHARRQANQQLRMQAQQLKKVIEENERYAKTSAEQAAKIAQGQAEIARRAVEIAGAVAERDRIIRLVDQFTSISIVAQGATLNPPVLENQPSKLRRT